MRLLTTAFKAVALTLAAIVILSTLGIGPLAGGYVILSLNDALAILPR